MYDVPIYVFNNPDLDNILYVFTLLNDYLVNITV